MTSLRAVFWDVDGTLADTEMDGHRPAFNAAFEELGLPISWEPDLYSELLSIPGGLRRVREYLSRCDLPVREEQLLALRDIKRRHYLERVQQGHVRWRPGVLRLLHALDAAEVKQWIVTSSGRPSVMALLDAGGDRLPRLLGSSAPMTSRTASHHRLAIGLPCSAVGSTQQRCWQWKIPPLA